MVSLQFMSLIKINIKKMISEFLKDLEEASPNTRRSFYEIYPLCFKVSVKNHLPIYIELNKDVRKIAFSSRKNLDFEVNPELNDIIDIIFKKKITRQIIQGDVELAMVFFNLVQKSNVDIIYLIDKYFGNNAAFISSQLHKEILYRDDNMKSKAGRLHKKLRDLHIRIDRLEARVV